MDCDKTVAKDREGRLAWRPRPEEPGSPESSGLSLFFPRIPDGGCLLLAKGTAIRTWMRRSL